MTKAQGYVPIEQHEENDRDNHTDGSDGGVLAIEKRRGALLNRKSNFLHAFVAGIGGKHGAAREHAIHDGKDSTGDNEGEHYGLTLPLIFRIRRSRLLGVFCQDSADGTFAASQDANRSKNERRTMPDGRCNGNRSQSATQLIFCISVLFMIPRPARRASRSRCRPGIEKSEPNGDGEHQCNRNHDGQINALPTDRVEQDA